MRLLIISSEFPPGPGGIGNHAQQLAANLKPLGWEITVLTPQDYVKPEAAEAFNATQPFRVVRVSSGRGQLREAGHRVRGALNLVKTERPDLVLGTGLSGVWVAAVVGALRGGPTVAVGHGSEFAMSKGLAARINRWAFQRMNAVVAVSRFTRGEIEKVGIHPQRVEVILNAADHRRFGRLPEPERQAFRQRMKLDGGLLLLTVGHVSERKGQEVVVRALPHILKEAPQAQYVMVGLPTLRPQLTALAQELGVAEHIHFAGSVSNEDMGRWLNSCDIFLMTSCTTASGDCEGFGIAVVEAALCGKPAVVSAQSGLTEAIQEGVTGLAAPERDAEATAQAVVSLLKDPERLRAMGAAAQARAEREQTWVTCAQRYDEVLRSVAKGGKA